MAVFGESILYIPLRGDLADKRRAKIEMEPRFQDGVFLGLTHRSDEIIIWGQEGIRKARTIRRRPETEQFDAKQLLAVRGTPLQPNPGENDTRIHTRMEYWQQRLTEGDLVDRRKVVYYLSYLFLYEQHID